MIDIRCAQCAKKLAEGQYTLLKIKCGRCGALNTFTERHRAPSPERPRASSTESPDDDQIRGRASAP
ncbi:MAG: Com family DNA-binding transcriptional regulator [Polaromonas sp.]